MTGGPAVVRLPRYAAMLAAPGRLPSTDTGWAYELKYDGIRAAAYVTESLRLISRNGNDITAAWPELTGLAPADPPYVVDGEIVAFVDGRPSFEALQPRMHQRDPRAIAALTETTPAVFVVFDLLHIGSRSLIDLPYLRRRELLEQIGLRGAHWRLSPRLAGRGADLLAQSRELGLEGLVAKRLDGRYLPGQRSPLWTKIKNVATVDVIVVGWRRGSGNRGGWIGSLLVAIPDGSGNLVWAGNVGTGFTRRALADLYARLSVLQRDTPPVVNAVTDADLFWVDPVLVGEVAFTEWTRDGILRHPVWRGLRDMHPSQVAPRPS
ncbi:non-homologous end-joining DNA ligase [Nocardia spumae]|uniref:non-homologous end-joining DNA ligase n=1 Tax=Nocardia spumae TaxID=2887190 RepID=UPI001D1574D4|nr:non-homologous end-joining DNA ligase [Nocardia spumae]